LQEAARCKVGRFVFASSTAVYGDVKTLPVKEVEAVNPISPYAASKAAGEAYCKAFLGCYGLSTVMLRFFNVYGPRNANSPYSGVITKFLQQAAKGGELRIYGDGEQTRDFIHVNDIVQALILALEAKDVDGEVFNACTGKPTSINMLADDVRATTGKDSTIVHAPAREGEIKFSYGDPSKALNKLKFKSQVGLREGLGLLLQSIA
jgi:UDP-glucose 4-epimerase